MLYVSYEDIGILIQIIETMNKRKLEKENCHENCIIKILKYWRNNNGIRNRR